MARPAVARKGPGLSPGEVVGRATYTAPSPKISARSRGILLAWLLI